MEVNYGYFSTPVWRPVTSLDTLDRTKAALAHTKRVAGPYGFFKYRITEKISDDIWDVVENA